MAQSNLSALYAELNKYGQGQEYERALKTANKILREKIGEELAFHYKVVCLIHLGRFEEALAAINKAQSLSNGLIFEKGYCEYRLNRTTEALKTLRTVANPDYRTRELLAQILYRLEQYEECCDLYRQLIKNSEDDFDEERETNLAAVLSSLQLWAGVDTKDPGLREVSYEMCYNKACLLIGKKHHKAAEEKIRKAEVLCRESFEDDPDVTEEDIDEELAVLHVQLAYLLQQQARTEEAMQIYNQVLKKRPSDTGVTAVASNNIVTLNKDQNVFDSKKKIKAATSSNLQQKLVSVQRQKICYNQCLLHLYTNQAVQCRLMAKELREKYRDAEAAVLIEAAQFMRDKHVSKAIELLTDYTGGKRNCVAVKLTLAQLFLGQGSVYQACEVIKLIGDLQYKPGVVSALVTLYTNQEDSEAASEVLDNAVSWYRKHQPNSSTFMTLLRANSNFHLKNNPEKSAALLEEFLKTNPKDPQVLAQLFGAYSRFDPKKAQFISQDLPSVDEIIEGVDVEELEKAFNLIGPKYLRKLQKPEPSPRVVELLQVKKKKRKKKGKLPKNYDPNVPPDPERWLPKKERSYYRGRRKDKKKDIGKGTQGATTPAGDIDASKQSSGPGSAASSPKPGSSAATPSPKSSSSTNIQSPKQQPQISRKKKKKGNKR